ncbi:hypothetical protein PGIGA_G00059390 [Pangasianodon gigas]|uniref:Uncharacterized protein n=1 Tax=Pangasianodon gigas TaxID=30993 RepID=A0ACC5X4N4_PANGG|nr:hypothetical protein [Pangasianodon gigas]
MHAYMMFLLLHLDPVQRASSDGHKDTQMDKATPEGSLAEAEEKKEKDEVSGVQLNSEELYVLNLEHRVMELEKLLCEAHRQSEMKSKECEQEQQAHRVLKEKCDEMKEVEKQNDELCKECEQERQAHSILKKEHDEMKEVVKQYEELLKGHESKLIDLEDRRRCLEELLFEVVQESEMKSKSSLAEAEERAKIALESNAQLEYENSILMEQVKTLQGSVENLKGQLCVIHRTRVKLLKNTLEHENSSLKDQVKTLQCSVEKLEGQLHETHRMCKEILNEWERERQYHSTLLSQYEDVKVSLAEVEKSAQNVLESGAQLEHENSNLMHQVNTLQVSVKALRGQLNETHCTCDGILKEQKRERQHYNVLWTHYEDTKSSLAEAEESAKIALESNAQLEYENSILMEQVKTLQGSVENMKGQLCVIHRTRVKLLKVSEKNLALICTFHL